MRSLTPTLLFVLAVSAFLFIPSPGDEARAQSCSISICKSAPGAGDTVFTFTGQRPGDIFEFDLVAGSECAFLPLDPTNDLRVVEVALPDWVLADVDCGVSGLEITPIRGGIFVECPAPGGSGTCTFINAPESISIRPIPTLSEWGMLAAAAGLGLAGAFYVLRRRKTAGV